MAVFVAVGSTLAMSAALRMVTSSSASPARADLRSTGLYADFDAKVVDPQNLAYAPQYPLWSDGAAKRRWIHLPPGTQVDASDPDVWDFPRGTKVWKEFSFGGRRIETRLIESLGAGVLRFASYAWNSSETDAVIVPREGLRGVVEIRPGVRHDIPGVLDCEACHVNKKAELLGFSALQLSPARDPLSPHAERVSRDMINLETLIKRGLIRSYPPIWKRRALRITAASPRGRAALGYFHANCGNCHNPGGGLDILNLLLRHLVAPGATGEPALETAVGKRGRFRIPGVEPGGTFLINPGDADHSAVVYRMSTRDPLRQMPPLGTKIIDADAVRLIRLWINLDLARELASN